MAKAALWAAPDADGAKARGAIRIGYPGSPGRKLWTLVLGWIASSRGEAYALSVPPAEYGRKTENHGNWGCLHKRRSMWLNWTLSQEPYQGCLYVWIMGPRAGKRRR
jgi:hypothetical protein